MKKRECKKKSGQGGAPNFLPRVPVRLAPFSHVLLPPRAKKSIVWPAPPGWSAPSSSRVQLGPEVLCLMSPYPAMLVKGAASRVISEILRGCMPPKAMRQQPFDHHWVLRVDLERPDVPLRGRTLEDEAYRLTVEAAAAAGGVPTVRVRSRAPWGALHALTTLRHLMQVEHTVESGEVRVYVPVCDIQDKPVHAHRALMVPYTRAPHVMDFVENGDPFEGTEKSDISEIFQWIDIGVQLKFNVLHWEVVIKTEEKLVHFVDLLRTTAGYAGRRGLQVMVQVDMDHPQIPPGRRTEFLRRMAAAVQDTSALLHLGPRGRRFLRHVPPRYTGVVGPPDTDDGAVDEDEGRDVNEGTAPPHLTEHVFDQWDGKTGDLLRFRNMMREEAFLRLLDLDQHPGAGGLRGGGVEIPMDVVPLLQVAAFLWDPRTMLRDVEEGAAVFKTVNDSMLASMALPSGAAHIIEAEKLRLEMAWEEQQEESHQSAPPSL